MVTKVKTAHEIAAMREGGRMLAAVLELLRGEVTEGISTKELADSARRELQSLGGHPAFLGYEGFPDVLCVSVNDEVVHGIPDAKRKLVQGDLVGLDFGVLYKGLITDGAISVSCGQPSAANDRFLKTTERALLAGIDAVKGGVHIGNISAAIQAVLDGVGLGIVRDLVGHGVGHELHEDPNIPNFGSKGEGPILKAGMTVAIEPMATLGGHAVFVAGDGWTVKTGDGSLAAHFEHTILVTADGSEILTTL